MKKNDKNTITEQLTECATKAVQHANNALDAKSVDQAYRGLEVCKQALELLDLLALVPTEPEA